MMKTNVTHDIINGKFKNRYIARHKTKLAKHFNPAFTKCTTESELTTITLIGNNLAFLSHYLVIVSSLSVVHLLKAAEGYLWVETLAQALSYYVPACSADILLFTDNTE